MSSESDVLLKQIARSALKQETLNIIQRVKDGKPLTTPQRKRLEQQAEWVDKNDLLKALGVLREAVCEDCVELVDQLLENINGESGERIDPAQG